MDREKANQIRIELIDALTAITIRHGLQEPRLRGVRFMQNQLVGRFELVEHSPEGLTKEEQAYAELRKFYPQLPKLQDTVKLKEKDYQVKGARSGRREPSILMRRLPDGRAFHVKLTDFLRFLVG